MRPLQRSWLLVIPLMGLLAGEAAAQACPDADGDGFTTCGADDDLSTLADNDCNDDLASGGAAIYPGAAELCDGIDSDCDGLSDGQDYDIGGQQGSQLPAETASHLPGGVIIPDASFGGGGTPSETLDSLAVFGLIGTISDVDVTLQILHFFREDLSIELTSPSGTVITLVDGVSSGSNFTDTVLDDEAISPVTTTAPPAGMTGNFTPVDALSAFDGEIPIGSWTLRITDNVSQLANAGALFSWSLHFTLIEPDDDDGDGWIGDCLPYGDCDDDDAATSPDAIDCPADGVDNDCDGSLDEGGDEDGDTYIDASCPSGDDCDDNNTSINPSQDFDGDGFHACEDCNDLITTIYPGAAIICGDGIDQDCSGFDEPLDFDADGYPDILCAGGTDCDDGDAGVNPGIDADGDGASACEDCNDGSSLQYPGNSEGWASAGSCDDFVDNDCDGYIDQDGVDEDSDGANACEDCDDSDPSRGPASAEICDDGIDQNCDGVDLASDQDSDGVASLACGGEDCDDDNDDNYPGNTELCDGIDQDCSAVPDDAPDLDGDGLGPCEGDCDDSDPSIFSGAPELCDEIDNNCDEVVDEGFVRDSDLDGFEDSACGGPDCDDSQPAIAPGADEDCADGIDNNCDNLLDESDPLCAQGCSCAAGGVSKAPSSSIWLLTALPALARRRRRGQVP